MDIRLKVAQHYVALKANPVTRDHAMHMVRKMEEEMELFKGLRELCNRLWMERKVPGDE